MALEIACPACRGALRVRESYAGKALKCPRCAAVVQVPLAPGSAKEAAIQVKPGQRGGAPPIPTARPEAGTAETGRSALPAGLAGQACPRCGKRVAAGAERCRHCRAWLDDEEPEGRLGRPARREFKPCPRCGATGAERVTWTPWGSFYGPALFTHVRCRECDYGYNGRTGRSNLVPAIFMVLVPLILIIAILLGIAIMLTRR